MTKYCPKCGTKNPDNSTFCENCREKIANIHKINKDTNTNKNEIKEIIIKVIITLREMLYKIELFLQNNDKSVIKKTTVNNTVQNNEIICPECNTKNPDNVKFCNTCGNQLNFECENCGSPINPKTRFCAECGKEIKIVKKI